jgi:hypothetical protein
MFAARVAVRPSTSSSAGPEPVPVPERALARVAELERALARAVGRPALVAVRPSTSSSALQEPVPERALARVAELERAVLELEQELERARALEPVLAPARAVEQGQEREPPLGRLQQQYCNSSTNGRY